MPPPIRGSDVFIGADVVRMMRAIAATHEAMRRVSKANGQYADGYSDGFLDGLKAMAESMGLHFQPGAGNVSIGAVSYTHLTLPTSDLV